MLYNTTVDVRSGTCANNSSLTRLPGAGGGGGVLLDAVGRAVRAVVVPAGGGERVLTTAGLPAGVYTLRVVMDGQVLTRKVLLE